MAPATSLSDASDEALLQRMAEQDFKASELFYDRHAPRLLGLMRQMLGEEREADDAFQAACLTLLDQSRAFDAKAFRAFPWTVQIFRRHALERLRALDWRGRPVEAEMLERPVLETLETTTSGTLQLKGLRHQVQTALLTLPMESRRWIESAFLKGLTCQALAESSGLSAPKVREILRGGVLQLHRAMTGESELPEVADIRQVEQAALHALQALDDEEQSALEIELARDGELERLAVDLEMMICNLASVVPVCRPGPDIKPVIMAEVRKKRAEAERARTAPRGTDGWILPVACGVAALLALGCFWLWTERQQLGQQVTAMTATEAEARQQLISVRDERDALEAKQLASLDRMQISVLKGLTEAAREAIAVVVLDPDRQVGLIRLEKLPPAETGKVYQLWITAAEGQPPFPVAVIRTDAKGQASVSFKPVSHAGAEAGFSLSLEREEGAAQPGELLLGHR